METLYETLLPNGLTVCIKNHTCRYFGDYHNVRLDITSEIPVPDEPVLRTQLGASVPFTCRLSRMGVASADVSAVQEELITNFRNTTLHYMSRPEFIQKYLVSQASRVSPRLRCLPGKRTL